MRKAKPEVFEPIAPLKETPASYTYALPSGDRIHFSCLPTVISMYKNHRVTFTTCQWESYLEYAGVQSGEGMHVKVKGIMVSEEDARTQVLKLLDDIGIDNMGIASVEKARIIQSNPPWEIYSVGYYYVLTRNDGGGMAIDTESATGGWLFPFPWESEQAMSELWEMERMTVYVDETGICEFEWKNPLSVAEELNENAALLPFDEMQEIIRRNIKICYGNAEYSLPKGTSLTLNIDKIVLSYMMIPAKNQPQYQLFVPAWIIFYSDDIDDKENLYQNRMFVINAIDGSVVHITTLFSSD